MNESEYDELERLRIENARLRALLAQHGIAIDEPAPSMPQKPSLSLEEKVNLFRSLFQGREDVFARQDNIEAQYSLESYNLPLGISQYELSKLIPKEIKSSLPSIEQIESTLEQLSDNNKD